LTKTVYLHHFDASPFAEKIRVALGIKGIAWRSVEIPMIMPKPDLTVLTGGYRKTPVLQIGADIYCDTQRIARELESRFPNFPSLFPIESSALNDLVAAWSDTALFRPGASLSMGTNLDLPEAVLADRFAFFDFMDRDTLPELLPQLFAQFRAGLQRIEDMLSDQRPFLLGELPGWADAACFAPVWMCRTNIRGATDLLAQLPLLEAWEKRVAALGHGEPQGSTAEQAIASACSATSVANKEVISDAIPSLPAGQLITVTPEDYGSVPVSGSLLRLTHYDVALKREDPRVGEVVVHFPRVGYKVEKQ
jgi:glutathione S-transferase